MKTRTKIIISILIGLVAMSLYSFPMWWGVLFSPITQELATTPVTEELTGGFCARTGGFVFRLKALDFLVGLFKGF